MNKILTREEIVSLVVKDHRDIPLRPYVIADELDDATMYTIYKNGKRRYTIVDHEENIDLFLYDSEGNFTK
jgi:hypothetical protein